jgi:hypothetical protein
MNLTAIQEQSLADLTIRQMCVTQSQMAVHRQALRCEELGVPQAQVAKAMGYTAGARRTRRYRSRLAAVTS